ncbi:hypothetical protein ACTXT7_016036 [Hymenolepis weldensis]
MSDSMPQSARFVEQPNPSVKQKLSSPYQSGQGWNFPQQCLFKQYRCKQCQKLYTKGLLSTGLPSTPELADSSNMTKIRRSLGYLLYRHQAKKEICESTDQWESCLSTTRYRFRYNHNLKGAMEIIRSSKVRISSLFAIRLTRKLSCRATDRDISISTTAYVADSQLNLPGLD